MDNNMTHSQQNAGPLHSTPLADPSVEPVEGVENTVNPALATGNFFAVVYQEKDRAEKVLETLQQLHAEKLVDLDDAVYVTKDKKGRAQLHETKHTAKKGSIVGQAVDSLLLFFLGKVMTDTIAPPVPSVTIETDFIRDLRQQMQPNSSALFLLLRKVPADEVLPRISAYGGTMLQTTLTAAAQTQLQQALKEARRHKEAQQEAQKEMQKAQREHKGADD